MQTIVVPVQPQTCMPHSIGYAKPRNQRNGEFTITTPSISRIIMFRTGQRSNIIRRRGGMSMILSLSQHKNLLSYLFTYLLTYILIRKAMQQRQHLFSVHDKNFLAAQQLPTNAVHELSWQSRRQDHHHNTFSNMAKPQCHKSWRS